MDEEENKKKIAELKNIVSKHPCQYARILKRKENKELLEWIEQKTLLLKDNFFKLSTKVYWILNGITEFPRCKNPNCNKEMKQNVGFGHKSYREYCSYSCANKCSVIKAQDTKEKLYGNRHYVNREKAKKTCLEKYGAENNMQSEKGKQEYVEGLKKKYGNEYINIFQISEVKEKCRNTKIEKYGNENFNNREKAKKSFLEKYGVEHHMQLKEIQEKRRLTLREHYGVDFPCQNLNILKKVFNGKSRYFYDSKYFDSKEELAYYIWLKDNNIKFEYHPLFFFEYEANRKKFKFFPDFKVDNRYVEIKGDQFFKNPNYKMSNPWAKSDEENAISEAKYNCIVKNNVKLLKSSDKFILDCIEFCKKKFGNSFFKINKIRKNDEKKM